MCRLADRITVRNAANAVSAERRAEMPEPDVTLIRKNLENVGCVCMHYRRTVPLKKFIARWTLVAPQNLTNHHNEVNSAKQHRIHHQH